MWADSALHTQSHEEICSDGTAIDVKVRLSRTGATQLFIGVYAPSGLAQFEGAYDSCPGESMTTALARGVDTARSVAIDGVLTAELLATS